MLGLDALIAPLLFQAQELAEKSVEVQKAVSPAPGDSESLRSILYSFEQFGHWNFLLRLVLGLGLAVTCATIIAWHPRRSTQSDPLADHEERKAFVLLGMVGAIVAELGINQNLAFVIFGIGALVRFRTVLDNPKATGKALLVVVIGLACGMGQWAMAAFTTAATWGLVYWLDSHVSCRVKLRVRSKQIDLRLLYGEVLEFLQQSHARVKSSAVYENKRQLVFLAHVPSDVDPVTLESAMRAKLGPRGEETEIEIRMG